jgi:hypothetical protein
MTSFEFLYLPQQLKQAGQKRNTSSNVEFGPRFEPPRRASRWERCAGCLSCLVLSCLVLPCRVVSCLVLSCPVLKLSCLVLSCLVLSCRVVSWHVLSCLVLSYGILVFRLPGCLDDLLLCFRALR